MRVNSIKIITIFLILFSNQSIAQKDLQFINATYESSIQTVQINRLGSAVEDALAPPVTQVNRRGLVLSFDDLREDADYYYVYFIHCNADWSPSRIRPNMYLNAYNEFEIASFEFSAEAKQMYVNYSIELPAFKASGNYLAVVYRDKDKEDIVLSRRFYVFEEKVKAGLKITRSTNPGNQRTHQRFEVTLNYAELNAVDPKTQFKVNVRQNQRDDYTAFELPTTFIDQNSKLIRYQNFGEQNEFPGTNEFRNFDLGTVTFNGRNIQDVKVQRNEVFAELRTDQPLADTYLQQLDINGQFYIRDLEGRAGSNTAEYIRTNLKLEYPETNEKVFVIGAFNNWRTSKDFEMIFNRSSELYEIELLVKQGWYNYTYVTSGVNTQEIDGTFFDTENFYEAFVYFRTMGGRGDQLVGYVTNAFNTRR